MIARTVFCIVAAALGLSAGAHAADPAEGRRLATIWCASCHAVGAEATIIDAARPFAAIARDPNFTDDGLRAWLVAPHPPMPELSLTRQEIDAIAAYLNALRRD